MKILLSLFVVVFPVVLGAGPVGDVVVGSGPGCRVLRACEAEKSGSLVVLRSQDGTASVPLAQASATLKARLEGTALPNAGYARLGETELQWTKRLGRAQAQLSTSPSTGSGPTASKGTAKGLVYRTEALNIEVYFVEDRAVRLAVTKRSKAMTEAEAMAFLTGECGGIWMKAMRGNESGWAREDGVFARLSSKGVLDVG